MPEVLLPLLAVLAYAAAGALLAGHLRKGESAGRLASGLPWPALLLHVASHASGWMRVQGPELHFFAALSLVGLGMATLTALAAHRQRLQALGVVVHPIAASTLLLYHFQGHGQAKAMDWPLQLHAWLALLAYATLAIAALLAIMLWLQDRALRRRQLGGWLRVLPPLTQLESLLFRSLAAGFLVLSLALLTGIVFVEDLLAQHLVHKTVLSALSWIVLAILLLGRWRHGWRGQRAVGFTLAAMALLALAFFGSKFVIELVLQRG